jgi:signal transduction histidine kinase
MRWKDIVTHARNFLSSPDEELGPDFLEEVRRGALRGWRLASGMALAAGLTFVAVHLLLLAERFPRLWVSLLGTTLLGFAGIVASYTRFGQRYPRSCSVATALCIGTLLVVSQLAIGPGSHIYGHFGGLTSILLVMAALGTLQPWWVLVTGIYFLSSYVLVGLWFDPSVGWPPAATFVLPCASLAVSTMISVWLSAVLDRSRRTEFVLRNQLARAFRDLQEAQAQLLASEKALTQSQVVAALSHELNSPLGVVVSNLSTQEKLSQRLQENWRASSESPGAVERLLSLHDELTQNSLTAARRIATLLERLREFSHLDRAATQWVDLNRELLKALEMVKSETRVSVEVETQFGPLPELLCQPQRLGMAFASLLRNAFQSIDSNGSVRLSTAHSNQHVEILIEDNGRGMDPAELKTIFDPKFVPESGKVRTSWGLATSQQIFLQHGGQLEVESTLGRGTTARVRLPVESMIGNATVGAAGAL